MFRFAIMIAGLVLISTQAHALSLRQQSVVTDDVIRLGDLFTGLEHNQDRVLGAAPRPGQQLVLSAKTLQRVAVAMGLAWRPTSVSDTLTISRSATVVSQDTVENAVRSQLQDKLNSAQYNILFTGGAPDIILPPDMPEAAEVTDLQYNPQTRWFEANLVAPSHDNVVVQKRISGKIETLAQIPTLKDTLRTGDVIRPSHIHMVTVPAYSINHDTYLRAEDLYGLTPRRIITAGTPIKEMDVEQPRIVKRGERVTMIYEAGGLRLTASGKAMEFGAKGDIIRVVNNQSNKTIDAVVSGNQEVTVATF